MLDTLKGELKIFTKEVKKSDDTTRVIFNTCVGATKTEDGYINYYMSTNFATALRKDLAKVYKQESFDVIVKEAWIKAYKDKDGNTKPILFINKATIVTTDKKAKSSKKKEEDLEPVEEDGLPF